jgi:tetratricopeptide (TPR) repeat protein
MQALWQWSVFEVIQELAALLTPSSPESCRQAIQCCGQMFSHVAGEEGPRAGVVREALARAVDLWKSQRDSHSTEKNQSSIDEAWQSAQELIGRQNFLEAKGHLQKLLDLENGHIGGLIALGDILSREGDADGAVLLLEQAIGIEPNSPKAWFSLGQAHHRHRDWPKAVQALQRALKLHPRLPQGYLLLGESLDALERDVDAATVYQQLVRLLPNHPLVWQRWARASFLAGRMKEAVGAAQKAAELGPVSPVVRLIGAVEQLLKGQERGALARIIQVFRECLADPVGLTSPELVRALAVMQRVVASAPLAAVAPTAIMSVVSPSPVSPPASASIPAKQAAPVAVSAGSPLGAAGPAIQPAAKKQPASPPSPPDPSPAGSTGG